MQNSLQRLLDGLATTLGELAGQATADPYVSAQLAAAAELLANLATRVEWRCDELLETCRRSREVIKAAVAAAPPDMLAAARAVAAGPEPSPGLPGSALTTARAAHLHALGEAAQWLATSPPGTGRAQRALREFIAWQVEHEATLLRTSMYRRPARGE